MCGIAGYIGQSEPETKGKIMAQMLVHRGPDDDGLLFEKDCDLVLAFRRLAIQDLSPAGHQPMNSASGRYSIVFNGEIYNFQDMRPELERQGANFKSHSDTEIILAALDLWGLDKTLARLNGMFAIALLDRKTKTLHLVRDRMGKKPLYYGQGKDGFYFASEMKAILKALPQKPAVNKDVAALYFHWNYVPDPYCIFEGFHKLPPGHVLSISLEDITRRELKPYWSLRDITARSDGFQGTYNEALDELEKRLSAASQRRMIADVPLGAFLSGGVDSSLIVALMQKHQQSETFTIGFEDKAYNEALYAREIAAHLGTTHTEKTLQGSDAMDIVQSLPAIFDEPFGDASAIPTYQVCRMARQNMTVALSGDGGDESFGGYSWYGRARKINALPKVLRSILGVPASHIPRKPQLRKLGSLLLAKNDEALYAALQSYWQTEDLLSYTPENLALPYHGMEGGLMSYDSVMFLPGDVLTKVDRTSMAVSLEVRSPLLDKEVVEFAWQLPPEMRKDKKILKDLLRRYLPDSMIDRPKQGFIIPHGQWLRTDLREWTEDLLASPNDFIDTARLQDIWQLHKDGHANYGYLLWTVVMFQSWHKATYG